MTIRKNDKHLTTPYYCGWEAGSEKWPYRAVVWQYGGCIKGAHQPFMIVDILECASDPHIRVAIEWAYPGIEYRNYPEVIDGEIVDREIREPDAVIMTALTDTARKFSTFENWQLNVLASFARRNMDILMQGWKATTQALLP